MATLSEDGSEYGVDEELRRDLRSLRAVLEEEGRQSGSGGQSYLGRRGGMRRRVKTN